MNKSIKFLALTSTLIASATVWAATSFNYTNTGAAGGFPITQTGANACASILATETIKPALSANVAGAFDCTNSVNVGVATANWKGRGRAYRVHTAGGNSPQESAVALRYVDLATAQAEAQKQATAANGEAGT